MNLTYVMAVYGQPKMLRVNLGTIAEYPKKIRERIKVIVVDDHGDPPVRAAEVEWLYRFFGLEVYRIDKDIPWNQMGARNLGMHHAEGWCLMLDPDMVVEPNMALRFFELLKGAQRGDVWKYGLRHKGRPEGVDMSSPNTYMIHRDDFWAVGGYDEDYAGHKGWSDVQLLDVLKAHYRLKKIPSVWADFYSQNEVVDAAVTSLDRNTRINKALRIRKANQAKRGGWKKWVKKSKGSVMRFPWHKVYP